MQRSMDRRGWSWSKSKWSNESMDQGEGRVAGRGFVLIADDDPNFVSELTTILADRGYLVLGQRTGKWRGIC